MRAKLILFLLVMLLSASLLCLSTSVPSEELLEKYGVVELVLGFLVVSMSISAPLLIPLFLFKRIW